MVLVVALLVAACMVGQAEAFLPQWWRPRPAGPADATGSGAANQPPECPTEVIKRLQTLSFEPLKMACPTRSDVPHDLRTCSECSCGVYELIKEAIGASDEEYHALAEACGPIFSLDTAFDG